MRTVVLVYAGLICALVSAAHAQTANSEPTALGPPGAHTAPPAPPVKLGMPIRDSSGAEVGVVQSVAETRAGDLNLVAKIEGKLIGLPVSTIHVVGDHVASSQTKEEMPRSAGSQP